MSAVAIARSSLATSAARYSRSWGLWLLLLVAPVGARFMIPQTDSGGGVVIAVNNQLPVMTSAFLGVSLGIVVTTLLLPIAFLYLRSNTTRRQPWQIEEVTAASRVAIALGRFAADSAVLLAVLTALTLAGWFLGWLIGPADGLHPLTIAFALWVVAAPALLGLAAIRILFDAVPLLRGAWGDLGYFVIWMGSIIAPSIAADHATGFKVNMLDFAGFVRPLIWDTPPGKRPDFAIGGIDAPQGKVTLDVMGGLLSDGYIASRFAWAGIAVAVVVLAGLVYRPHRVKRQWRLGGALARLLAPSAPPAADLSAPPAPSSRFPALGLFAAEAHLIAGSRLFWLLAAGVAASGLFADFRHETSPAALLLLIFGLAAHAGRSEAAGLLSLTRTASFAPWQRRTAFVLAGTAWSLALSLPAAAKTMSVAPLILGLETGGAAALTAMVLAAFSRSAFAPRVVLLVGWYAYLSA